MRNWVKTIRNWLEREDGLPFWMFREFMLQPMVVTFGAAFGLLVYEVLFERANPEVLALPLLLLWVMVSHLGLYRRQVLT